VKNDVCREQPSERELDNLLSAPALINPSLQGSLAKSGSPLPYKRRFDGGRARGVKIRADVHIAPVEAPGYKSDGTYRFLRVEAQAARCPVCKALLAVGQSFDQHVFFCRRSR